jgi:quercetin dioxygenase-like cupin family protein
MAIHHARAGEIVELSPLGDALKTARTRAIVKADGFEVVRLAVHAGQKIAPHQVPGPIMLHCLEGRVTLGLTHGTIELAAGQWVWLDGGERHAVDGIEDSSLLLTILLDRE